MKTENERSVADDESCISVAVAGLDYVAYFSVTSNVARLGVPYVLEQELEKGDARHGTSADNHFAPRQLTGWISGKQHY